LVFSDQLLLMKLCRLLPFVLAPPSFSPPQSPSVLIPLRGGLMRPLRSKEGRGCDCLPWRIRAEAKY
jgi:hypothetical protein